jgi:shikimate kinase
MVNPSPMNIFLIGFMGSGKSSLGKKLAERLGYGFADMDEIIEQKEGMPVMEIFRKKGEEQFRKLERKTLEKLVCKENMVISTGGGVPCRPGNMELINQHGISVYLEMSPADLFERLKTRREKRPLIRDLSDAELREFINSTLAEREKYYRKATFTVNGLKRDVDLILEMLD